MIRLCISLIHFINKIRKGSKLVMDYKYDKYDV